MIRKIEATFDGSVFRPAQVIELAPNTRVHLTVETLADKSPSVRSFLKTAQSLNLEGPSDWSTNLHQYLYGVERSDEQGTLPG